MAILDEMSNKTLYSSSLRKWLWDYHIEVQRYLDEKVDIYSHEELWAKFATKPLLGKVVVQDYETENEVKQDRLISELCDKSTLALVNGIRGSGKTATICWIAEEVYERYGPKKPIVFVQVDIELPDYVITVDSLNSDKIPPNSLIFVDEASLTYQARRAMSRENVEMGQQLAVSRHKGHSIVFVSQHTGLVDVNILRMADVFIFKKLSWEETTSSTDRGVSTLMEFISLMMPAKKNEILWTNNESWYLTRVPLPSFWTEDISKSYKKITWNEGIKLAKQWNEAQWSMNKIERELRVRGLNVTNKDVIMMIFD